MPHFFISNDMRETIKSLNTQQKQIFDEVYNVNIEIL